MIDLIGVLPYFLILMLVLLHSLQHDQHRMFLSVCIILFCFSAFRYDVGWDYSAYYSMAEGFATNRSEDYELFPKLFLIAAELFEMPSVFFLLISFFTIFLIYLTFRNTSFPSFSLLAYFCIPVFFMESLSTVRFHLALSVILLAEYYAFAKRWLSFFLLLIVAFNCHISATIMIILPLLLVYIPNRLVNISILLISSLLSKFLFNILINMNFLSLEVETYLNLAGETPGFTLLPILFLLCDAFHLLYYNRFVALNPILKTYIYLYNVGCCIMLLFSFEATLSSRLSKFFIAVLLFILPYYQFAFSQRKLVNQITYVFLISIFLMNLYVSSHAYSSGAVEKNQYIPYQLVFFNDGTFR